MVWKAILLACAHKSNSSPDPRSGNVSEAGAKHAPCWYPAIRCDLCRALLYHELDLVPQSLLHVWVLIYLLWYYGRLFP